MLVCDGLGHGPLAAAATDAALSRLPGRPGRAAGAWSSSTCTAAMSHTRGAALAVAELDPAAGTLRYAGLGNIPAVIVGDGTPPRAGLAARDRRPPAPRRPGVRVPVRRRRALLVMHSDGVADRWHLADYPGLLGPLAAGDRRHGAARRRQSAATTPASWSPGVMVDDRAGRHAPPLLQMALRVEHDIFVVRQRGREVAALLGLEHQDQVRIATALSEVGAGTCCAPPAARTCSSRSIPTAPPDGLLSVDLAPAATASTAAARRPQSGAVARLVDTLERGDRRSGLRS